MRYVTYNELSRMIRGSLWKIPHDIDLVVGIPRSGLMVANMVALYLNKRLSDIDSFIDGRIFDIGNSRRHMMSYTPIHKVLVVDDSICTGNSILAAKRKLDTIVNQYEFVYFTPIITNEGLALVDYYAEIINEPRIFEWNLFHHCSLENACVDLDGVLCSDPPIDDDGELYTNYILNATPLFIPTAIIGTIVTCRLEKYRPQTEQWLEKQHIKYKRLIMLNLPDKQTRIKWGRHGEYKAECLIKYGGSFFIESSLSQAQIIAEKTNRDVICIETNALLHIEQNPRMKRAKKRLKHYFPKSFRLAKRILHS